MGMSKAMTASHQARPQIFFGGLAFYGGLRKRWPQQKAAPSNMTGLETQLGGILRLSLKARLKDVKLFKTNLTTDRKKKLQMFITSDYRLKNMARNV
jgi:hypothetical protein